MSPYKAQRSCKAPGCPNLTDHRSGYCNIHLKEVRKQYDDRRPSSSERGYDARWRKARVIYLRKHPLCAECEKQGKVVVATIVDHIQPHKGNQELFWNEANWEALCADCHNKKSSWEDGRQFGSHQGQVIHMSATLQKPEVVIVCGPPGSGKSSYVEKHRGPVDLVIDLDRIWQAFTGLPYYEKPAGLLGYILAARDAVLYKLNSVGPVRRVWFVIGAPTSGEREEFASKYNAKVIVLNISPTECLRRIRNDPRRSDKWQLWEPLVIKWHSKYMQREGDTVIKDC